MNKKILKIIIFLGILFVFFLKAHFASAIGLEVKYPSLFGFSINNTSTFPEYVRYFFNIGMILSSFIAAIVIAWGGIQYMFTLGIGKMIDPKKGTRAPDEAKSWLKAGISGLLLVFLAYLIAYTINPNLVGFGLEKLIPLPWANTSNTSTLPPNVNITSYQEIPIGVLTENLLTGKMDCYGFDQEGNPVNGDQIAGSKNSPIYGPTYLDHDRVDCLSQLADGAQKKAQVVAALSDEITKLMNQCSCAGKCNPSPPCQGQCNQPLTCPGGTCTGACVGASCQQPPNTTDCCPAVALDSKGKPIKDSNNKTISVKQQIEHGPITMSIKAVGGVGGNCQTDALEYKGLDEFRCPEGQQCTGISSLVEKSVRANNRIFVIIDQDKWAKLTALQQLTYFKEKTNEIRQAIQKDRDALDKAKTALGKCYLAVSYVDLLKVHQNTNNQESVVFSYNFSDPSGNSIDASKYCNGFNYNNSSCLKKCNDMCPDTSPAAIQLYKNNTADIQEAYNKRPCIYGTASQTFEGCISSCQDDCVTNCEKKYLSCSDEYNFCESQCNDNSQCVLDNAGSCLISNKNFNQCSNPNQLVDQGNIDYCINNAYLCKNGSDEYAGYSDCANPSSVNCSSFNNQKSCENATECIWNNEKCSQNYSSSFFYNNPNSQKCILPYQPPNSSSACYSRTNATAACKDLCPETAKCPTTSKCPSCPCDEIDQTINFSIPNESTGKNAGNEGSTTEERKISSHQMVGPQCNGYSYNDDPLTFYCEDSWWTNPSREGLSSTPIGVERVCQKSGEVPVGQTVDDAENWADGIIKANKVDQDMTSLVTLMVKIGDAKDTNPIKDYCKCGAKLESGDSICKTGCQYNQQQVEVPIYGQDEYGDQIQVGSTRQWACSCIFKPCSGEPCKQITDYLTELWNSYRELKIDFVDLYTAMLAEPRSDIIKELTYSRKATNSCSLVSSAYGAQTRLLDCTRVEDELITPVSNGQIKYNGQTIDGYCYGKNLGNIFDKPLTDNWFCCQQYSKTTTTGR
jgi:hypothetical protein